MKQKEIIQAREVFKHVTKLQQQISEYNTLLESFAETKYQIQGEPFLHEMQQRVSVIRGIYKDLADIKCFCEEQRLDNILDFTFAAALYCADALAQVDNMDYYQGNPEALPDFAHIEDQLQWIRALL